MLLNKTGEPVISRDARIAAVREYLAGKKTLREIAADLGVSHAGIWHWVRRYKTRGPAGLENRQEGSVSRRIKTGAVVQSVQMKERQPGLSIRKARTMLRDAGWNVSTFWIWRVWREHALLKEKGEDPLDPFVRSTPAHERALNEARQCAKEGRYPEAAAVLNRMPGLPRTEILGTIPERFLSLRRRLERLFLERRQGSYEKYAVRARKVSRMLEKRSLVFSSIIADFLELDALDIIGQPELKARVLERLEMKMRGVKSFPLKFLFYFEKVYTDVYRLRIDSALRSLEVCRRVAYTLPFPRYYEMLGALLVLTGRFRKAVRYYQKAFEASPRSGGEMNLVLQIARYAHCYAAEYRTCRHLLAGVRKPLERGNPSSLLSAYDLTRAYMQYGLGQLAEARESYVRSLETASGGNHVNRIYAASVGLAGVAMALNNRADARLYLRKYLPLMKKNRLLREELLLRCFIDPSADIPVELRMMPPFRLLDMLQRAERSDRIGDYRKCLEFARDHGLEGLFHRWIVFYPDIVMRLLDRGKRTDLPRAILNFPVFNQKIPVCQVKLLGRMLVVRNSQRMRLRLAPKEKSFLIHLALRANAPGRSILIEDLRRNFWPKSPDAAGLLSHLMVRLRKGLRLPAHLLAVKHGGRGGRSMLINNGVYFTTDYQEFRALLTQANTLRLSGEWGFARREYLRAFAMLRAGPFKDMYDPWSEQMRDAILNATENNIADFIRESEMRDRKGDANKILEKVASVFPGMSDGQDG